MSDQSRYGVKIGKCVYVEACFRHEDGRINFNSLEFEAGMNSAKRWRLNNVSEAAELADALGGRVVRFRTKRKRVIVSEREGFDEEKKR